VLRFSASGKRFFKSPGFVTGGHPTAATVCGEVMDKREPDGRELKVAFSEEDRYKAGLLKLSIVLKREPQRNLDEIIDDIVKKNSLDRARFVDYIARHREVITSTVKGSAR
jgi:hypothetical protein